MSLAQRGDGTGSSARRDSLTLTRNSVVHILGWASHQWGARRQGDSTIVTGDNAVGETGGLVLCEMSFWTDVVTCAKWWINSLWFPHGADGRKYIWWGFAGFSKESAARISIKGALSDGLNFFLWTPSSPRYVILVRTRKKLSQRCSQYAYGLEPYAVL